ncbi:MULTISPECIES: CocE/NonD family hydrolase [unclassified Spirosoma]|uniref:CocE/NonD family hydrolase n=1 Tax=unclassified Spirosoma TaxID=2621999 RepID=UPI00095BD86E|nr:MULTISPECIES: CocE/NonD family hydrolase [unclassified Spirosoma]OJW74146.1 MAG: peptidase S15 [Spirosoma sp. 48-14]
MRIIRKRLLYLSLLFLSSFISIAQQTVSTKANDATSPYDIQDNVLITTQDGASISAMVVRKKGVTEPLPVVLQFTIYVRDKGRDMKSLKESADRGYVGVIAYTRGKRFSPNAIYPYEHEATDTYDVIDWISRQPWCNGSVGMFGGSYNGFSQWAACKKLHPALKTIVPYVANRPGMGLPMENNVFVNPNYEWSFYVGNNKYLDTLVGNDRKRFRKMMFDWWQSGVAYNRMDSLDGTPNKWFQRWISHPNFDRYWQKMAPYERDFASINIPILAFDGYYNDSQNSSLYYLRELQKYAPQTPCYLVIGPYGHFGTQIGGERVINGYSVDSVALFDIKKITYQWFDHILKQGPKPEMLADKINYEVMGANSWRSAPSLDKMHNAYLTFYLTDQKTGDFYALRPTKPAKTGYLSQQVDFADRQTSTNNYYPDPISRKEIDTSNGFVFISEPLSESMLINGSFLAQLNISINKKDVDLGVTLYELTPAGDYFHLSYYIGRASYANDITKRTLLTPNAQTTIDVSNTHLVSKQLSKGSRLVVAINVNKNPFSQLNYGTGNDVSTESIHDAKEPLRINWYTNSYIRIPVWR